ncbi:hypothetical protein HPB51_023492 [Rhipicephalus microplus]|uniref:Uncharacterized protein n=1 Tax=Rhipicephalus microplus TaxID=6941 RepID=A0A9J6EJ33_RHIMP|nr:hypothetical protein HPB51_023492 [Rhipicephalus microplus]
MVSMKRKHLHYLSTTWGSLRSETVRKCSRKCGFWRQPASKDTECSEYDSVACTFDIDDDIDEEYSSIGANAPFVAFVSIGDNVPTWELQSYADMVAEVVGAGAAKEVGDEALEDSGENESVCRLANFVESLTGLEALKSFFCRKKTMKMWTRIYNVC